VTGELVTRSPDEQNQPVAVDPLAWLSPAERYAYDYITPRLGRGDSKTFPIAPDRAAGLFELFLRGRSLRQVFEASEGRFSLGQVVHAAVEGDWPRRRAAALDDALGRAAETAATAAAEAAGFIADSIAIAAKQQRHRANRYLQTGDATGIPDLTSPAVFGKLVDALGKLTGTDRVHRIDHTGSVEHHHSGPPAPAVRSGDHASALSGLAEAEKAKRLEQAGR
jgi:hypothetical protein